MKRIIKVQSDHGYANIDPDFIWDKGTEDERKIPCLTYLVVKDSKQGKGYGECLVWKVYKWMQENSVESLAFKDFSGGFWKRMKEKNPCILDLHLKSKTCIMRLNPTLTVDGVFK